MQRLTVDLHLNENGALHAIGEDVRRGLTAEPKYLLPKYFYDDAGSALFERITELPEYYVARAERGLLKSIAPELMAAVLPEELVELGSGSSSKTRMLLDSLNGANRVARYLPFDVSEGIVRSAASSLLKDYPALEIHGVIGDFEHHLQLCPSSAGRRLVLFLGSTIGNLNKVDRHRFLGQVQGLMGPKDRLLLGVDLVKETAVLEAAYNDSAGVTAEFNRNILRVINRNLRADFDSEAYQHRAHYNQPEARIEMHLAPLSPQSVHIADLGLDVEVVPGETLWTESSHKFTQASTASMLAAAGFILEHWYIGDPPLFGIALATGA